jgi:hypothetical protein
MVGPFLDHAVRRHGDNSAEAQPNTYQAPRVKGTQESLDAVRSNAPVLVVESVDL